MLSNILDRVSFFSLFVVIILFPIFFLPIKTIPIETSKGFLLVIGLVISIVFWAAARFSDGKIVLPKSFLIASIGLIAITTLVSTSFSSAFSSSFFGVMFDIGSFWFILSLFLVTLMASILINTEKKVKIVLIGIVLSSLVLFVFQFLHFLMPNTLSLNVLGNNTDNLFGSWNSLGIFSGLMALISLFVLELFPLSKIRKIIISFLLILSLFMIMSVNFTLVWILIGIFSLIIFVYKISLASFGQDDNNKNTFPFVSFAMIILSLLFIMSGQFIGNYLPNTLKLYNIEVNPSISATANVGLSMLKIDPIFGIGPNRFADMWSLYKPDIINNSQFWNTSFSFGFGSIPTFMISGGVLTILSWLIFLILLVFSGIKNTFISVKGENDTDIVLYFIASLYLFLAAIFYPASISVLVLAFIFIGIFIGVYSNRLQKNITISFLDDPRKSFFSILFLVILMITTAGFTFKYMERFFSVHYFGKALASTSIEDAESYMNKALLLNQNDLYLRTYSQVYISKINSLLSGKSNLTDIEKVSLQSYIDKALNGANLAIEYNKGNYLNFETLGFVYKNIASLGVENSATKGIEAYSEAIKLNPKNPLLKLEIARIYLIDKKTKEAKDFALQSVELKPDFAQGLIFLAELEKSTGNINNAISYAEKALFYFPNDKDLITYINSLKGNKTNIEAPEIIEDKNTETKKN